MKKDIGILLIFVVLCTALALMNPRFLSATNLQNTARLIGMFGIFSIGVGFVIVTGGIDLSSGSLFSFLGVLLCVGLVDFRLPWPLVVAAVLVLGGLLGLFHGLVVTRLGVQPFIITLCGLLWYRGLANFLANDSTKGFGHCQDFQTLAALATGNVLGIPIPFVLLCVIGAMAWVVLHRSVYGRYLLAVGQNEEAARFSGVNTKRVITSAYVISGGLGAVSAIFFAFYANAVQPSSHGSFYELFGIAAAVLGGCSLRGGEGSVVGILIGTALLQVLKNLVNLLGIRSSLDFAVMGTVIFIGVVTDEMLKRRKNKRAQSKRQTQEDRSRQTEIARPMESL